MSISVFFAEGWGGRGRLYALPNSRPQCRHHTFPSTTSTSSEPQYRQIIIRLTPFLSYFPPLPPTHRARPSPHRPTEGPPERPSLRTNTTRPDTPLLRPPPATTTATCHLYPLFYPLPISYHTCLPLSTTQRYHFLCPNGCLNTPPFGGYPTPHFDFVKNSTSPTSPPSKEK